MAPADKVATTTATLSRDLQEILKRLDGNQEKWHNLSVESKLKFLEQMMQAASDAEEDWLRMGEWNASTMMGIPMHTPEGQYRMAEEAYIQAILIKSTLERLVEAYKMKLGINPNATAYKQGITAKKAVNGQVTVRSFPILTKDKFGPFGGMIVDWWLDPDKVPSIEKAPEPFQLEAFDDGAKDGVMLVLGCGNQSFLTVTDALEGLFVRQRVVLVKHHPLRGVGLEPILRKLMAPLYEAGYFDSALDTGSAEANTALVYSPLVKAVHMTGGKATHDAIV